MMKEERKELIAITFIVIGVVSMLINNWTIYEEVNHDAKGLVGLDQTTRSMLEIESRKVELVEHAAMRNHVISFICLLSGIALFLMRKRKNF